MQILTVTYHGHALAVVRAPSEAEAVTIARAMIASRGEPDRVPPHEAFLARRASDGEMIGWLEHRSDYLLANGAAYALAKVIEKD